MTFLDHGSDAAKLQDENSETVGMQMRQESLRNMGW